MIKFTAQDIEVERYAAVPSLSLKVGIAETSEETVHSVALRCQVRIEPQRRAYSDAEAEGLQDLFGGRIRWKDTLRPFLWGHTSAMVPGFTGDTVVNLPFPLTYDLEVAAAKYLHTVRDGEIPLSLMFSGTAFLRGDNGFRVQQVPWDTDQSYRMPVKVWRDAMDEFFPGAGWILLDTETLDMLLHVRSEFGMTNWAETFAALLAKAGMAPS
ncbi:MAG: DUF6084 family protein [Nakamurella sp.]